jgi:hypothetical protein
LASADIVQNANTGRNWEREVGGIEGRWITEATCLVRDGIFSESDPRGLPGLGTTLLGWRIGSGSEGWGVGGFEVPREVEPTVLRKLLNEMVEGTAALRFRIDCCVTGVWKVIADGLNGCACVCEVINDEPTGAVAGWEWAEKLHGVAAASWSGGGLTEVAFYAKHVRFADVEFAGDDACWK